MREAPQTKIAPKYLPVDPGFLKEIAPPRFITPACTGPGSGGFLFPGCRPVTPARSKPGRPDDPFFSILCSSWRFLFLPIHFRF
jgi:hypothetical protein